MRRFSLVIVALGLSVAPLFAADPSASPNKEEKEIVLTGGNTVDRMAFDPVGNRLFVAHAGVVDVVDVAKGERVGVVEGVDRAHGVAIVPELKIGFASAAKNNVLVVFSLETLKKTKEIRTGDNPDAVLYVASTKEVWVFNAASNDVTVVDPVTLELKKAAIKLDGKPEGAVEHPGRGIVYVNIVGDHDGITAIDARAKKVLGSHPLVVGVEPTGLAIDLKTGLLFSGCKNQKLVIMDSTTWKSVADYEIGEQCEGVAFDPGTGNMFASCFTATRVVHVKDAKSFQILTSLQTPGGKTCTIDPKTHRVFVVTGPKKGEEGEVKLLTFLPPK